MHVDEKTKFEPDAFRDDLVEELSKCEGDFAKVNRTYDSVQCAQ